MARSCFDPDAPEAGSVRFTIQAASINTNEPARDAHLRSTDFFAVDEHPTLTFVSREVNPGTRREFDVIGDLTIRGITRPVTLEATYLGAAKDPWGNDKVAFEAETTLNRKDFGLHVECGARNRRVPGRRRRSRAAVDPGGRASDAKTRRVRFTKNVKFTRRVFLRLP